MQKENITPVVRRDAETPQKRRCLAGKQACSASQSASCDESSPSPLIPAVLPCKVAQQEPDAGAQQVADDINAHRQKAASAPQEVVDWRTQSERLADYRLATKYARRLHYHTCRVEAGTSGVVRKSAIRAAWSKLTFGEKRKYCARAADEIAMSKEAQCAIARYLRWSDGDGSSPNERLSKESQSI